MAARCLAGFAVSQVLREALAFAKASFYFLAPWSAGSEKAGAGAKTGALGMGQAAIWTRPTRDGNAN
jgi:hypothetical protein